MISALILIGAIGFIITPLFFYYVKHDPKIKVIRKMPDKESTRKGGLFTGGIFSIIAGAILTIVGIALPKIQITDEYPYLVNLESQKMALLIFGIIILCVGITLLIVRYIKKSQTTETVTVNKIGNADELLKYKELLDAGIITQQEFDEKKRQLLGI